MQHPLPVHRLYHRVGLAVAFTLVVGISDVLAQQVHSFPGSTCQASGSAQDLYYSTSSIANRTNSTASAVCPVLRSNPTQPWSRIAVYVRDRHSTGNITCVARAHGVSGGAAWSDTQSTVGEGEQVLVFGGPGAAVPNFGPYTVVCSIPPMEEANNPSYISTYIIVEP